MEPSAFIATLERLWSRSGLLHWALAAACVVAYVALVVGAHFDPPTFGTAAQSANAWVLPFGVALLVLAVFRTYRERTQRGLRIVPRERQFSWGVTKQTDGRMTVQISGPFEVYNLSDQPIIFAEVRSIKPRITRQFVDRTVCVKDPRSGYSGNYAIAARTKGEGSIHLIGLQDFSSRGPQMDIVVKVSDQFGRWHKIKVRRVSRVPPPTRSI